MPIRTVSRRPRVSHAWSDTLYIQGNAINVGDNSNRLVPVGAVVELTHLFITFRAAVSADWQLYSYIGPPYITITAGPVEPVGFSNQQYFDIFSSSGIGGTNLFHTVDLVNPVPLLPGQSIGCYTIQTSAPAPMVQTLQVLARGRLTQ